MVKQEQMNNPYDICSWRPASKCKDCTIAGHLKCRYNPGDLLHFIGLFLSFLIPAVIGMILSGYGWYLLGWLGLAIIFFGFWETRILCSHCPYYAERGSTLHCVANYGCPKFWKYHPEPISKLEKIQLIIGFIIMCGYPFPFLILGEQFILTLLTLWGGIMFWWTLQKYICSKCINFSCLLNRVPKEVVDEYLKRNPIMRKAWKENGWRIGGTTGDYHDKYHK
ncbi:hypothetical protein KJ599_02730 [bacterium]|nr:hypothetical protein [bacterium]